MALCQAFVGKIIDVGRRVPKVLNSGLQSRYLTWQQHLAIDKASEDCMSYCLNPACPNPENLVNTELCQACGSKLLLRDRYRVLQALGQGGFGATFLSKDESLPGNSFVLPPALPMSCKWREICFSEKPKLLAK